MQYLRQKDEQIKELKYKLIDRYTILMASVLIVYIIIFTFFIPNKILSWYLIVGLLFATYSYLLVRKKYNISVIVHMYLIVASIFNFYIMLIFWHNSVASFCWLLPIPLAAHIFFGRKEVLVYTIYILLNIIVGYMIAHNFSFPAHSQQEVIFTDILVYVSNIIVVALLIYYKDKIRKLEVLSRFMKAEETHKETIKVTENALTEDADVENIENLFGKIENVMTEDMLFKDVKFNLSKLSVVLDINTTYISKAIRYKGYTNFNSYLNIYRINHVKQLFNEIDFQKTTLMYIYTEAGFSNQSTFNRVFKQIEEITPSEYVQLNYKN